MPLNSPVFYLGVMAFLGIVGMICARTSGFYRRLLAGGDGDRVECLDGLRGVLALNVFMCHSMHYYNYYTAGAMGIPRQSLHFLLGSVGVSTFFMITGFLFWSKAIRGAGRLNPWRLYWSRIRRVYPMYLFSFLVVLVIVGFRTQWQLREAAGKVAAAVGQWMLCGLAGFPVVNACTPWGVVNAGVVWSLQWETYFYLLLPVLALLAKPRRFFPTLLLFLLVWPITRKYVNYALCLDFVLGMLAAYLLSWRGTLPAAKTGWCSTGLALLAVGLYLAAQRLPSGSWRMIAFPGFLLVLYGSDAFGMLTRRAWRFLGTLSYSVYLIHGSVLYLGLGVVDRHWPIRTMSPWHYWVVIGGCGALLVVIASLTYWCIEYPFIKRVARWHRVDSPMAQSPQAAVRLAA